MARTAAPRLLGVLALGAALLGLAREGAAAPAELSVVEDWKIQGVYDTSSGLGLSYGVFFDPYSHDEYSTSSGVDGGTQKTDTWL